MTVEAVAGENDVYVTRRSLMLAATGLVATPHLARAAFPERPLRIMVGFAAGGTVDTIARILANALSPILGQNVIVENRPAARPASRRRRWYSPSRTDTRC